MLYAATLRRQQANVVQRGLFTFRGLPARSYFLVALDAVQEGRWYDPGFLEGLKERATRLALADAEAKPVDLVANGTSELKAVVGEVVLTIATLTGDWTLESVAFNGRDVARPDQRGEFSIKELPAGHYLIAAVDYVQDGQSYDPEFLAYLRPRAQRLSLAEAESKDRCDRGQIGIPDAQYLLLPSADCAETARSRQATTFDPLGQLFRRDCRFTAAHWALRRSATCLTRPG